MAKANNKPFCLALLLLMLVSTPPLASAQLEAVRDFIQSNLVGLPVIHEKTHWPFDPDVAQRRSRQWQRLNGVKGEKLIERLGLGIDGHEDERLAQQRARDEGHLGGLNYFTP